MMKDELCTIVVTGGSQGIGAATALLAGARGYHVCLTYLNNGDAAKNIVSEIKRAGGRATAVKVEISNPDDIARLFASVTELPGRLCALVNNVGVSTGRSDLSNIDIKSIRHTIDVNLIGYLLCAQHAIRQMSTEQGGRGGSIINVSSQAGVFGGMRLVPYAASKAAVNTFTVGLAREVAPLGIRVNAVSPGIIETPGMIDANLGGQMTVENRQEMERQIPLGRLGKPNDVAMAIMWLLSDEAAYVTGVVLPVAGGR